MFEVGTGSLINLKSAKNGKVPRISVKTSDNGIIGYFDESLENARYFDNFISVNFFGISYYHPYRASLEMKVHTLKFKNRDFTNAEGAFISAMINKRFDGLFSYGTQLSSSKLKDNDYKIQLPTKKGKIDFEFMESFIAEIENEQIKKLTNYLEVTGLKDYTLTAEEEKVLADFENGKVVWGEFNIDSLFEIHNTLSFNKDSLIDGNEYDYVTRTSQNQGILQETGFVNNENINTSGNWSLGLLQMDFFYRHKPWYAGQFIRKITSKTNLNKSSILYYSTLLNKLKYNLLNVLVRDVDKAFLSSKLILPKNNNQIDYKYIETFITVIQKLVIKDVVMYADKKIEATKSIVN